MTQSVASSRLPRVRAIGWAALVASLIGPSYAPVTAEERSNEAGPACSDTALARVDFEPIMQKVSTSAVLGQGDVEVRWVLSSEVTASGDSPPTPRRYCYAYIFRNVGSTPVKISLVSHRLALSPLFEAMQDFSLELNPGATEVIRFTAGSAPELALATAYNSARDEKIAKWALVSSGPISLYLPAALQAAFTLPD
jgi:hypothetical protein